MTSYVRNKKSIVKLIIIFFLLHIFVSTSIALASGILKWRTDPSSTSKRLPKYDPNSPMRFSEFQFCPGNICPYVILAEGVIRDNSIDQFKEFIKKTDYSGYIVCFNSIGGSLEGGIALGREIRKRGFDTCLLNYYTSENTDGEVTIYAENSVCLSACAYTFLGGVTREIEPNAKFGVHQFSGQQGNLGDSATQSALAEISAYLDEMGIDRRLLDIASRIPAEEMPPVSLNTSKRLEVDNYGESKGHKWSIEVSESEIPYIFIQDENPYNKRVRVMLIVSRLDNNILLQIKVDYNPKYYENISQKLKEVFFSDEDGNTPSLEINIDGQDVAEYSKVDYKILNNSISPVLKINSDLLRYMLNGNNIGINISLANVWRDYNPGMNFTLKGFRKTMKVILK